MQIELMHELIERAPRTRCYWCGSADIACVCHHCGKPMCAEHSDRGAVAADSLLNRVLSGLGLRDTHADLVHCEYDFHIVWGGLRRVIYLGIGIGVLGILVALASLAVGLILVVLGAGLAVGGYFASQRLEDAARAARPPLALAPNLDSISVREMLHGEVRLDEDGKYTSMPSPVSGDLEVVMTLGSEDRARLDAYRERYDPPADQPVEFSAGYGMVKGEAGFAFGQSAEYAPTPLPGGTGIAFRGQVGAHPLFTVTEGGSPVRWTAQCGYYLQESREPRSIPVWLVPSLVPASDQRTLEIDLHWAELGDKRRPLTLESFEEIELHVPTAWGNVEGLNMANAHIGNPDSSRTRRITWKPSKEDWKDGSLKLTIQFEKKIEKEHRLSGRFKTTFLRTLSGIEGLTLYQSSGLPLRNQPKTTIKTEVAVDFDLSLNAVRHQNTQVVPDHDRSGAGDQDDVDNFAALPDYLNVIDLTNALSDNGRYVKRVVENPPRGGVSANLVNRFWDIAGRYYDGIYPIDFHIALTGEEQYQGGVRAHAGSAAVRLIVKGSYVNPIMQRKIKEEWAALHELIESTLNDPKRAVPPPQHSQQYQVTPSVPRPRPPADYDAAEYNTTEHSDPATARPAMTRPATATDSSQRAAVLHRRLEAAQDAVVEGRIDTETYREIKARIEHELAELSIGS